MPTLKLPDTETVLASLSAVASEHVGQETVSFTLPVADCPAVLDPYNQRLKVYELGAGELTASLAEAGEGSTDLIGKVTAYALPGDGRDWTEMGFRREAVIRGFYPDGVDAHLWAAYADPERLSSANEPVHQAGVAIAQSKGRLLAPELPDGFDCRIAEPGDAEQIAGLMTQTFEDYPTPIESELINEQIRTLANHFRVVEDSQGQLAAVASAEIDHSRASAEMTDCATRRDLRGKGLMAYILDRLERDLRGRFGITDLYTLARADEIGMNCVFSKLGYDFSGRLINNCRMPNGWESMNVWCKSAVPV